MLFGVVDLDPKCHLVLIVDGYLCLVTTQLVLMFSLKQWFSIQGDFVPSLSGVLGNVWRSFYLSPLVVLLASSEWDPGMLLNPL